MENGYLYLKIDDQLLAWNKAGRRINSNKIFVTTF